MSRYTIAVQDGCEFVAGWDPPMGTYFAQAYDASVPEDEEDLVWWVGNQMRQIPTLGELRAVLENNHGVRIPFAIQEKLAADQAEPWEPGPLQRRLGFTGKSAETKRAGD